MDKIHRALYPITLGVGFIIGVTLTALVASGKIHKLEVSVVGLAVYIEGMNK